MWWARAQIEMLRPGLVGTYDAFGERFCGQKVQLARGVSDWRCAALPKLNDVFSFLEAAQGIFLNPHEDHCKSCSTSVTLGKL